ncbi:MAG: ATP-binding cassette domain-containing protein [Yoonia sp.]|uniref:ATP-binding cassette domain-containing protein n=1 Tax=Yoonia sp. TaxID=2212373 RepID=UPI003EF780C2
MTVDTVLRLSKVVKSFGAVKALRGVDLDVKAGEVHALLGENGAGKSTLMNIAAGALGADSGTIEIGGTTLDKAAPGLARELGISVVYQHTSVIDDLTVAENMLYSVPDAHRQAQGDMRKWVLDQLAFIGRGIDPSRKVLELSAAERQMVEISRALAQKPKVLVLDEPTEPLTHAETETLFENIARITAMGTAVVYISHRLPDVKRVADRLTILRDGETRGTYEIGSISEAEILKLIIGRPIESAFPQKAALAPGVMPLIQTKKLSSAMLQDVNFDAKPGEIVGLAGIEGNGQREFIRTLAGLEGASGDLKVEGHTVALGKADAAQKAGIVYLPGDRHAEGLFYGQSIRENLSMLVLPDISNKGFVSRNKESELAAREIEALAIKSASMESDVGSLSGGNQQKVLFGRSLARQPKVLLADEPTRGVDAGARVELYRYLRELANAGAAVVVLSSDAVELQGLCDRVVIFSRGRIIRTLAGAEITEENITGAAITSDATRDPAQLQSDTGRFQKLATSDSFPTAILLGLIALLGVYTAGINEFFLSERSVGGILFLASALAFIGMGQLIVLLTGGIDLSVGPVAGLTVVILSFFVGDGTGSADLILGLFVAFSAAAFIGLMNGLLIRSLGINAVITTLSTFIAIEGVMLLLRPIPGGYYRYELIDALSVRLGPLPVSFIIAVLVAIVCEVILRKTRYGIGLRAIGSNPTAAHRIGAKVDRNIVLAYVLCSVFAAIGGLLLAAQVGVGDPNVGKNYTLASISAVILGGASIFGGRGSFLGALAAVILIEEIAAATGFLGLSTAWQYWLPGLLILIAAGAYSKSQTSSVTHRA